MSTELERVVIDAITESMESDDALDEARQLIRAVEDRGYVILPQSAESFYDAFKAELDKVTIEADAPATAVVGVCLRAALRAQRVIDGEPVSDGPWVVSATNPGIEPVAAGGE